MKATFMLRKGLVSITQATFKSPNCISSHLKVSLQKLRRQKGKGNILFNLNPFAIRPRVIHHTPPNEFWLNKQNKKFLELNTVRHYRRPHAGDHPGADMLHHRWPVGSTPAVNRAIGGPGRAAFRGVFVPIVYLSPIITYLL
jgi:hypothetical protein